MSGWAEKTLAKLASDEQAEQERNQKYLAERSQIKAAAPASLGSVIGNLGNGS